MDCPWLTEEMPGEIAMSIFLKLPVKSLVRFRSVSKSILAAVQSPDFIASHLSLQKQSRDPQILIQLSRTNYRRDKRYYFTTLSTELHPTENIQMSFWNDPGGRPVVHGPCNGLLCLSSYDRIALWNPSTREIKHVPPSTIHQGPAPVSVYSPVGFGFDPKSGDYKVIRFFSKTGWRDDGIDQVEIYSLNSNSWREIIPGPERYGDGFPTFVGFEDGLMYWKVDAYGHECIISFDLTDESFTCTTTPEFEEHCLWHFVDRSDGHMTLIAYPFDGDERVFDLWVNKDEWIKELSSYPLPGVITPLRFWKDEQLFFESFEGELLLIDIKSGEMKNLGIISADTLTMQVILIVESLVPIGGRTEQQEGILRDIIHQ